MSIGFSHHSAILAKVKTPEERKFYIQLAADIQLTVDALERLTGIGKGVIHRIWCTGH